MAKHAKRNNPNTTTIEAEEVETETKESVLSRIKTRFESISFATPAVKNIARHLIALTIGAIITIVGGAAALAISESLAVGLATISGSFWLGYMVWVCCSTIALVASLYLGAQAARYVYNRSFKEDAAAVSERVSEAKSKFMNWFASNDEAKVAH